MRIMKNESPYDTRVVRRVLQAVYQAFRRREGVVPFWPALRMYLLTGRAQRLRSDWWLDQAHPPSCTLYLPPLQGTEFIGLLRQRYGGQTDVDHGGLTAEQLAFWLQSVLFEKLGRRRNPWASKVLIDGGRMLRGIPPRIPFRIIKPEPPRDRLRERLDRTVELEKTWRRKAKLAATKLKKLRQRRLRYEKQLAQREEIT